MSRHNSCPNKHAQCGKLSHHFSFRYRKPHFFNSRNVHPAQIRRPEQPCLTLTSDSPNQSATSHVHQRPHRCRRSFLAITRGSTRTTNPVLSDRRHILVRNCVRRVSREEGMIRTDGWITLAEGTGLPLSAPGRRHIMPPTADLQSLLRIQSPETQLSPAGGTGISRDPFTVLRQFATQCSQRGGLPDGAFTWTRQSH